MELCISKINNKKYLAFLLGISLQATPVFSDDPLESTGSTGGCSPSRVLAGDPRCLTSFEGGTDVGNGTGGDPVVPLLQEIDPMPTAVQWCESIGPLLIEAADWSETLSDPYVRRSFLFSRFREILAHYRSNPDTPIQPLTYQLLLRLLAINENLPSQADPGIAPSLGRAGDEAASLVLSRFARVGARVARVFDRTEYLDLFRRCHHGRGHCGSAWSDVRFEGQTVERYVEAANLVLGQLFSPTGQSGEYRRTRQLAEMRRRLAETLRRFEEMRRLPGRRRPWWIIQERIRRAQERVRELELELELGQLGQEQLHGQVEPNLLDSLSRDRWELLTSYHLIAWLWQDMRTSPVRRALSCVSGDLQATYQRVHSFFENGGVAGTTDRTMRSFVRRRLHRILINLRLIRTGGESCR